MIYREEFKVMSRDKDVTFHDVTAKTKEIVERSGIKNGIVVVYSHHTTCCVITQECAFDMSMTGLETLQQDLVDVFEKIIPTYRTDGMYHHPGQKANAQTSPILKPACSAAKVPIATFDESHIRISVRVVSAIRLNITRSFLGMDGLFIGVLKGLQSPSITP